MKRVLITGANSYIGTSFEKYIKENYPDEFVVDTVDMTDESWREKSFAEYDSILHVAGIAHSDSGKISSEKEKLYYKINTDLTLETAKKAKAEGVKQFVFMSSAIVYGASAPIGKTKVITKETPVNPENAYGDSKAQAEKGLTLLDDDQFKVAIIRSPMVYGKGCKGNYKILSKIGRTLPFFPHVTNFRSMIYIENLCEFLRLVIENKENGIFWPQNPEYSTTCEIVRIIAKSNGRKIALIKGFGWMLKFMARFVSITNKAFGNLVYDMSMSEYSAEYRIYSLVESIDRTEK